MAELIISCLSQKGGVGKSTLARLIAQVYAGGGWRVKICDFNTRQLTSVDWVALRKDQHVTPDIEAQPYNSVKNFKREPYDLLVVDGKPDSDQSSLEIARASNLVIVPTGLALDDLKPQVLFANELKTKGVEQRRIMIVLNKVTESAAALYEAREYVKSAGYMVADTDLSARTGYQLAQNSGRSIAETAFSTLNERANQLATEIITRVGELTET